jgi:uncharacterized protein (TIGR02996 family)
MTTDQDFLDAILADPADTDLRMVYADYLDESGRFGMADAFRWQAEKKWGVFASFGTLVKGKVNRPDPNYQEYTETDYKISGRFLKPWPKPMLFPLPTDFGTIGALACETAISVLDFYPTRKDSVFNLSLYPFVILDNITTELKDNLQNFRGRILPVMYKDIIAWSINLGTIRFAFKQIHVS